MFRCQRWSKPLLFRSRILLPDELQHLPPEFLWLRPIRASSCAAVLDCVRAIKKKFQSLMVSLYVRMRALTPGLGSTCSNSGGACVSADDALRRFPPAGCAL